MLQSFSQSMKPHWRRALAMLLVLLTVVGMLPTTAFAADTIYVATGDFEVNVAGSTGWNGTCNPLPVFDSESSVKEVASVPASDGAEPVPFVILEDNGGERVKISLTDGKTGWVDKAHIFVNLPDVLPSIAYNLTNAGKRVFNLRLDRKEYIVPCMYTLAQRLAKVQKSAMANGETLIICEAFRTNGTSGHQAGLSVDMTLAKGDPDIQSGWYGLSEI